MKRIRIWIVTVLIAAMTLAACGESAPETGSSISHETVPSNKGDGKHESTITPDGSTEKGSEGDKPSVSPDETTQDVQGIEKLYESTGFETDSESYCVVDEEGKVWFGKNELQAMAPASITKVLTALTALDYLEPDQKVTIQETDVRENIDIMSSGVTPSFKPEETVTVRDLLYALMLSSTNSAANILARETAGGLNTFAHMMNKKATSLGAYHSNFVNASGLDTDGHYTCAYDMALILKGAMENDVLRKIMSTTWYTIPATEYAPERGCGMGHAMVSGNYECEGVFAGKTGWTVNAGRTLVTAAERNGKSFYICTMRSDDDKAYEDTENLIECAYGKVNGTSSPVKTILHDAFVTVDDASGCDISFSVDNGFRSARIVFWREEDGTAGAQFYDIHDPSDRNTVHFAFSGNGCYNVQIVAADNDGTEQYYSKKYLHTGSLLEPGIHHWNGQDYVVDSHGFLMIGPAETADGCYYTNSDGGICHGFANRYYAGADGKIISGWFEADYTKYYAQADGRLVSGDYIIDGTLYHFTDYGALIED